MTNLVVQTDRENLSAKFSLSPFVTDWGAARETFIACIADAFREPLTPRPEDFSTGFPTELGEAWCKYRMFGGSSTIVLRADSIAVTFSNIVRADYALVGEILRRAVEILLPKVGGYNEHSYHVSTSQHAAAVNGRADEYLAGHASAKIESAASETEMEYHPCIAFSLKTSDGYRVLRRTIEQSEVLENGLFIADHVSVRAPELNKFEDELRWMVHLSSAADHVAGIKQEDDADDAARA